MRKKKKKRREKGEPTSHKTLTSRNSPSVNSSILSSPTGSTTSNTSCPRDGALGSTRSRKMRSVLVVFHSINVVVIYVAMCAYVIAFRKSSRKKKRRKKEKNPMNRNQKLGPHFSPPCPRMWKWTAWPPGHAPSPHTWSLNTRSPS